ncbi:phage tail protein [Streptococcus sp. H49]|uniref:phage tail tube protein n=1 Tax=Streptococcus huangxiaojuni TaxID=3237239 RepID=UPI0034A15B79
MPRQKNAKRKHFIAPWDPANPKTEPDSDYKWLAAGITTAEPDNDEDTEDTAYYDGDGTPTTVVTTVKNGYSFEGEYIKEDEAQKMIADMRFATGEDRNVWFKVVDSDGKDQYSGPATVSDIEIAGGDADEYEAFKAKITWNEVPKKSAVVGG